MMKIKPIHNESQYKAALKAVSPFFENEPLLGSPDADFFEIMLTLIESYEGKNFPIDLPDPIEAIKFRMEQSGLAPKDLQPILGKSNRIYEILNRKRSLTIGMIRRLNSDLGIPAECLIKPTKLSNAVVTKPNKAKGHPKVAFCFIGGAGNRKFGEINLIKHLLTLVTIL
jgi:HTH-type transcriptional regulator / antitoxin HigA